jgi:phosphatidylserine/phosphatidylglycerophosphate/cardiolipin synthase-like enzyme
MHNKFFVFLRREDAKPPSPDDEDGLHMHAAGYTYSLAPYAVWTGSFNPTLNGGRSFENAVFIEDPVVAKAYLEEWAKILALSEPLDWTAAWAAPDLRIGS